MKEAQLAKYLKRVHELVKHFRFFDIIYLPRVKNIQDDLLSKLIGTKNLLHDRTIIKDTIVAPST